jgi:hypothetical protein
MKTIQFTATRTVADATGNVTKTFEAGSRHTLPDASASHWIRRGVAVDVETLREERAGDAATDTAGMDAGGEVSTEPKSQKPKTRRGATKES